MRGKYFFSKIIVLLLFFSFILTAFYWTESFGKEMVNVTAFGAIGNGDVDETDAIQKAIDFQSANGGGTVYIPEGNYLVDAKKSIVLKSNVNLNFADGAILKALPNNLERYEVLRIHDVENVKILGFPSIIGDRDNHLGVTGEWGFGISIRGSDNILVENAEISNCWGDGIYIGNTTTKSFSEKIQIKNTRLSNNRRQGISVISVKDLLIQDVVITDTNGTNPQSGIDFEPNNIYERMEKVRVVNLSTRNNVGGGLKIYLGRLKGGDIPVDIYVDSKDNIKDNIIVTGINELKGTINIGGYYYLTETEIVSKPKISSITNRSTTIEGNANPAISIEAKVDGQLIGNKQSDKAGNFSIPITKQTAGTNVVLIAIDKFGNMSKETTIVVNKFIGEKPSKIAGQNRYETAVEISRKSWNTADTVILATGEDFPDSLTGGPLAFKEKAPILLTRSKALTKVTEDEIARLKTKKIILVGGKIAISEEIEALLKKKGLAVERIGGANRYATAALIANRLKSETAVIGYGQNFPDVLSVTPYAAKNGIPILLTRKDRLPAETKNALTGKTKTLVIGGTGAVEQKVMGELPNPVRYGGATRYETAKVVITKLPLGVQQGFVATGLNFPDALAGGPLAAKSNAPIFLVEQQKVPEVYKDILTNYLGFTILGSSGVVGNEIADALYRSLTE